MNLDTQLESIVESLQDAVRVCDQVDSREESGIERTYPYATGYSTSSMRSCIHDLNRIIEEYRDITCEQE
jgi:hypothetical protein|tara:strand:+ start:332 stop:541 length:210 start_codon:yes stop_codon:yes gene_type:complete